MDYVSATVVALLFGGAAVGPLVPAAQPAPAPVAPSGFGPAIDAEVRGAVRQGRIPVLIQVLPGGGFRPEGDIPTAAGVAAQRQAIESAQSEVLSRLAGTDAVVLRRYTSVPYLALEIGADALTRLGRMGDVVARVVRDTPMRREPHMGPSTPRGTVP